MSPSRSADRLQEQLSDAESLNTPGADHVLRQLDRVLSNHRFTRAEGLSSLLRFVVTETLEGRGACLKEYELGVQALGRPPHYDPRVDPIVRVQARVLRLKLADYYQTDGAEDEILIGLPKGTYAPVFRRRVLPDPEKQIVVGPERAWRTVPLRFALVGAIVVVFAALAVGWRVGRLSDAATSPDRVAIAVLPFTQAGASVDQYQYMSAGLSDGIARALQKVPHVQVVRAGGTVPLTRDRTQLTALGRQLGVSSIVTGDVAVNDNRVHVTLRVVRLPDGATLWSNAFEDHRSAIAELQVKAAAAVAAALALEISPDTRQRLESRPTGDAEAELLYMRARYFAKQRSRSGMLTAIDLFRTAIERDPRYALAHAGLAEAYALAIWYVPLSAAEARVNAKRAALTAVELDPTLAEAHAALGRVHGSEWQWRESLQSFERAIQLNPSDADAHHGFAYALLITDQRVAAVDAIRRAQQLDPLSGVINADVAELLYHAGRSHEAIEQAQATLALDPSLPMTQWVLGMAFKRLGRDPEAIAAFLREKTLKGEPAAVVSALEQAFARGGWAAYWRAELEFERKRDDDAAPYAIGRLHGWLGDADWAFTWLERAYRAHDVMLMNLRIDLQDALGRDPRFTELVRRLGL